MANANASRESAFHVSMEINAPHTNCAGAKWALTFAYVASHPSFGGCSFRFDRPGDICQADWLKLALGHDAVIECKSADGSTAVLASEGGRFEFKTRVSAGGGKYSTCAKWDCPAEYFLPDLNKHLATAEKLNLHWPGK